MNRRGKQQTEKKKNNKWTYLSIHWCAYRVSFNVCIYNRIVIHSARIEQSERTLYAARGERAFQSEGKKNERRRLLYLTLYLSAYYLFRSRASSFFLSCSPSFFLPLSRASSLSVFCFSCFLFTSYMPYIYFTLLLLFRWICLQFFLLVHSASLFFSSLLLCFCRICSTLLLAQASAYKRLSRRQAYSCI